MSDIQQKQKYLRQHVQEDQKQDFVQFFQNQANQLGIDQISLDQIKKIVNKFKSLKAQQQKQDNHQRSFAIYQTADIQQALSIVTAINNTINPLQQKGQIQKSATDLLDSVFEESQSSSSANFNNYSPPQHNTNINNIQKNYRSSTQISFFENGNIWATTSNVNQARKSAQFDNFWQIPNTNNGIIPKQSTSQYKTQNPYNNLHLLGNQNSSPTKQSNQKPAQKIPSFQELQKNLNMTKKSTPYIVENEIPSNMKKQQTNNQTKDFNTNNKNSLIQGQIKNGNSQINFRTNQIKSNDSGANNGQIKLISQKPLSRQSMTKPGNVASTYKMNKIPYQGPVIHKVPFADTIKCYEAMPRPQLNDKDLSVIIQKHQIIERNFFVSDYVMYYLTVKPFGIVCKRNYQDFTKLRAALQKVYPCIQLPYLQKNSWFETNLQNIKKQKAMLQFFLHDLIKNAQIRNSRIFQDFLTLKDHKAIKRKFQQYVKMDKFKCIQQLCLLGGKVQVHINQNQRIYHQQLGKYLDNMEDFLNRKTKLMDILGEQFNAVNQTLISLSKLAQNISEQTKNFNQRVNGDEIPSLESTFNIVSKSLQQWASRINFESKLVTKRLAPFYKYQKDNIITMRQILNNQAMFYRSYIKRINSQNPNTGQSYNSQKLKIFKTGILQQSKNITVLKYQLGYMSNMVCKQTARFFQLMADSFKQKWIYSAEKYKQRFTKDLQFYNSIAVMTV